MSGLESQLPLLLLYLTVASLLAVATSRWLRAPYTVALALVGLLFGTAGLEIPVTFSYELVVFVLLPALLFEGAVSIEYEHLKRVLPAAAGVAVLGLGLSVAVIGVVGHELFGFPLAVALLLGVIVMPTDPVAVIAVLDAVGTPEELSTLVEGESMLNDGLGIVLYTSLLGFLTGSASPDRIATAEHVGRLTIEVGQAISGGVFVGGLAGYVVYRILLELDEPFPETLLTFVLAYGSFLVAEQYFHASGVIATATAALVVGNWGEAHAMSGRTRETVFNAWELLAYLFNTFVFLAIGVTTPLGLLWEHATAALVGVVLVLGIRPLFNYPILTVANRLFPHEIPPAHRVVSIWGGIHATISIALVLGLPETAALAPYRDQLRAMVFAVALAGLLLQALSLPWLLRALGVTDSGTGFEWVENPE